MWLSLALSAACAAVASPQAQETSSPPAEAGTASALAPAGTSRVVRAALFKNGLAFVRREAQIAPGTTLARLTDLPAPTHGTFWLLGDPEKLTIGSAVARPDVLLERAPALDVVELLRANVGAALTLHLSDDTTLSGTLLAMPQPQPGAENPMAFGEARIWPPPQTVGNLVLIDRGGSVVALAPGDVRRVVVEGGSLSREYERRRAGASLTIDVAPRGSGPSTLGVQYLERGLTWVPSYALDVSAADQAVLSAKAEVINEAEDLAGATLEFVTGFPNLQFSHVISPIALRGDLDAFLRALGQAPVQGMDVMAQSVLSNMARASEESASFPVYADPAAGASVEDLFFYEQANVTLARGERGLYPLFSVRVPYQHIYEWRIGDTIDLGYNRGNEPPAEEEIWHSLRLENTSQVPWTTAPAITQKGGRLLGQDTLTYTAVGAKATVRITRAVDVQGNKAEYEIERVSNAARLFNDSYDQVTVRGELRVQNHKREAVVLEIKKRLQGEVTANPQEAQITTAAEGLRRVNPNQDLTWSIPLAAGATAEVGYTYKLYVRP
jgi:hypothetical protein